MTQIKEESHQDLPIMHGPSGVIATVALVTGAAALAWACVVWADDKRLWEMGAFAPPSLLAVNLSFCAMLAGAWAVYRVRRRGGQGLVRGAAVAGLVLGLAGPAVFSAQSVQLRAAMAGRELANVEAIARGARAYAEKHGGMYAADLKTLLETRAIKGEDLQSPYTPMRPDPSPPIRTWATEDPKVRQEENRKVCQKLAADSDYEYEGAGLRVGAVGGAEGKVIVVFGKEPRMRAILAVGFMDGHGELLGAEGVARAKAADEAARTGIKALTAPASGT